MKFKSIALYILFFFVSVVVFLFLLFPQQQLAQVISQTMTLPPSGIYTRIDSAKLSLPLHLKLNNTRISIGENTIIEPDMLKIFMGPRLVFGDNRQVRFASKIYDGMVKGRVGFNPTDPVVYTNANFTFEGLSFDKYPYNTRLAQMTLSGTIDGEFIFDPNPDNKKDPGQGTIMIKDFSAVLKNSFFNTLKLPEIKFTSVDAQFTKDRHTVNIFSLNAKGPVINLKLNGIIRFALPLGNSRLSMVGTVLPDSPYLAKFANSANLRAMTKNIKKDGIRFQINGVLKQPRIEL